MNQIAKNRRVLGRRLPLFHTTRFPAHKQRPEYYCPWGATELGTGPGGKTVPLYQV